MGVVSPAEPEYAPAPAEVLAARARFPREVLLERIARDIRALFPGRIERLVLYGSRARGDARDLGSIDDSDWDVAVFLRDAGPEDRDRLIDWSLALSGESGWAIEARVLPEGSWATRTIFMFGLRRDAIEL